MKSSELTSNEAETYIIILDNMTLCYGTKTIKLCVCAQSCLTLCTPMNCSSPGSSVHVISQARILSGLPLPSLGDLPDPGIEPESPVSPALAGRFFTTEPPSRVTLKLVMPSGLIQ